MWDRETMAELRIEFGRARNKYCCSDGMCGAEDCRRCGSEYAHGDEDEDCEDDCEDDCDEDCDCDDEDCEDCEDCE